MAFSVYYLVYKSGFEVHCFKLCAPKLNYFCLQIVDSIVVIKAPPSLQHRSHVG